MIILIDYKNEVNGPENYNKDGWRHIHHVNGNRIRIANFA